MCVLCKFYGQHRFHKYEVLGKTANQYCATVTEKLDKIEKMANELDAAAKGLWEAEQQVGNSARKTQDVLEKHFDGKLLLDVHELLHAVNWTSIAPCSNIL